MPQSVTGMTVTNFGRGGSLSPRRDCRLPIDISRGQTVIETKSERNRYESPSVRLAAERLRSVPCAEPESEEILERSEQMVKGDPTSEHYRAVREVFTVPTSSSARQKVKPRHISYFEQLVVRQSCFLNNDSFIHSFFQLKFHQHALF